LSGVRARGISLPAFQESFFMRLAREFAFSFASQDETWLRARLAEAGAIFRGTRESQALFLDTPNGAIRKLGLGLGLRRRDKMNSSRLRRIPLPASKRWERSIEDLWPVSHSREKFEACLRSDAVREALGLSLSSETEEIFFALHFATAELEIRIDRSKIRAAGDEFIIATVAIRHISGSFPDFLNGLREIAGSPQLRLCVESVLVRALRHAPIDWHHHVDAFAPRLGRAMDVRGAFQAVVQGCFDQFLLNESLIREARDPEAVHQCRVALRRLRSALRLFLPRAENGGEENWRRDLKHFSALLRDARDLDVLLSEQVQPALSLAPSAGLAALLNEIKARREQAYDKLVAALRGPQAAAFYLDVALWIEAGDFGVPEIWHETVTAFMQKRLSKAARKLLKRGELIETDSEHRRHRTRIAAKNLRYGAEFFESLLLSKTARKRFTAFIEALKEIQEILGEHNDEVAAEDFFAKMAQELCASDADALADAVATAKTLAASSHAMPEADYLRKAKHAFRSLAETKPFWTKVSDSSKTYDRREAALPPPGSG
jgi:triphosphatase